MSEPYPKKILYISVITRSNIVRSQYFGANPCDLILPTYMAYIQQIWLIKNKME